jgi:hypothetical protein
VQSSEKDFETLQLGAFTTAGLLLAQGPKGLAAESGFKLAVVSDSVRIKNKTNAVTEVVCLGKVCR